jgi:hypothetical protein
VASEIRPHCLAAHGALDVLRKARALEHTQALQHEWLVLQQHDAFGVLLLLLHFTGARCYAV